MKNKVIWVGPEREIPGYCLAKTGEYLPDHIPDMFINSFVDQGLAKIEVPSTKKSSEKEDK